MKSLIIFLSCSFFTLGVLAQNPEAIFNMASIAPVIDAEVDEVWVEANIYPIDKPFRNELPTVEGSTWKGLWTMEGVYILVEAKDDEWLPMYLDNPPGSSVWQYDAPEIYFDVNYILEDGGGGGIEGSGHYMLAPTPTMGKTDGTLLTCGFRGATEGSILYSITVSAPNVNYEYFIPMELLVDEDDIGVDLTGIIGFDVTLVDRDTGDDARKRAVWANDGEMDESWNNMDDCGRVIFDGAESPVYVEYIALQIR